MYKIRNINIKSLLLSVRFVFRFFLIGRVLFNKIGSQLERLEYQIGIYCMSVTIESEKHWVTNHPILILYH